MIDKAVEILDQTVARLDRLRQTDGLNSKNVNAVLIELKAKVHGLKDEIAKALVKGYVESVAAVRGEPEAPKNDGDGN
jgi:hypothetical protein